MAEQIEVARAYVTIVPSLEGAQKTITNELVPAAQQAGDEAGEKSSKSFGSKFKDGLATSAKAMGVAIASATAIAAKSIYDLSKAAIESYADYEQLTGGVETLFGAGGQSIDEYAASVGKSVDEVKGEYNSLIAAQEDVMKNAQIAYKTAGLSTNEYMETVTGFSASLIASLGGDTAKAAQVADQAILDMSDNANKMGSDMQSIQNAYAGFAKGNFGMLDNLKIGYGGTKAEMERLLADAEELSGVHYDLDNFSDITEAIHVIQTEMGITGTTAKEAEHTISGSIGMLQGAWSNVMIGLADDNADLSYLIDNLIDSLGSVIDNLLPRIKIAFKGVLDLLKGLLPKILELVNDLMPDILSTITDAIPEFMKAGADLISTLLKGVMSVMPQVIKELPAMVNTVVDAIVDICGTIVDYLPEILEVVINAAIDIIVSLSTKIVDLIPKFINGIKNLISGIVKALPSLASNLTQGFIELVTMVVTMIPEIVPIVFDAVSEIITTVVDMIPTLVPILVEGWITAFNTVINALPTLIPNLINGLLQLIVSLIPSLPNIIVPLIEAIPMIITTVTSGIVSNAPLLIEGLLQLIPAIIEASIMLVFALIEMIPQILPPLWESIVNFFTIVWEGWIVPAANAVGEFFTMIWEFLVDLFTPAINWFNDNVITPITEAFRIVWEAVSGFFVNLWNEIVYWFDTIIGPWIEIAKRAFLLFYDQVIVPLQNWFSEMWTSISTWASNAWSVITSVWNAVSGWFYNTIIAPISNYFTSLWNSLKTGASNAWAGIKSVFSTVAEWFKNIFSTAWNNVKNVFSVGGKIFDGIKDGIANAFKAVVNTVIRGINTVVAIPFNGINGALNTLRNLSVLGVRPFTWLPSIGVPQIPQLAEGGIVDEARLSVIGEDGAEAVIPLEKNTQWIDSLSDKLVGKMTESYNTNSFISELNKPSKRDGDIIINVYGAEGQDVESLAEIVMNKIQRAIDREEVAYA